MSALLAELQGKGLLGRTLMVLGTEFGRTPQLNGSNGRTTTRGFLFHSPIRATLCNVCGEYRTVLAPTSRSDLP